ncbi:serine/threonine-protein kinase MARK1-like X6 [Biomphalaria pfeifferi]|uniref:Serine/threonine-protein kinase MARK1-like X6 n=1 Tax=Biomphalaria pfeifferi TaxID=112525 RepID=A0AAD8CAY8_BIOPF|nr:serine/threonine-protein kinase MARK1-like X6 [Biomphalaria pfeifferi]
MMGKLDSRKAALAKEVPLQGVPTDALYLLAHVASEGLSINSWTVSFATHNECTVCELRGKYRHSFKKTQID